MFIHLLVPNRLDHSSFLQKLIFIKKFFKLFGYTLQYVGSWFPDQDRTHTILGGIVLSNGPPGKSPNFLFCTGV